MPFWAVLGAGMAAVVGSPLLVVVGRLELRVVVVR